MQPHIQDLYVREIKTQAFQAIRATQEVDRLGNELARDNTPGLMPDSRVLDTFRNLHSLLTHAANISKIFYPIVRREVPSDPTERDKRQKRIDRGDYLKTLYGIQDSNVLLSRTLRDNLDHFDERLDLFAIDYEENYPSCGFADLVFGPVPVMGDGREVQSVLRRFQRQDGISFHFMNQSFDLMALSNAIIEVHTKSEEIFINSSGASTS